MSFIGRTTILRPDGVTPLTDEDIRRVAPSAFAAEAHESRSARYAYIPTADVIRGKRVATVAKCAMDVTFSGGTAA